jgi:16S rRNA (guanine527-N7)-methyltransferase
MEQCKQYVYDQLLGVSQNPDTVLERLSWFISELQKWNRSINLTSVYEYTECWEKHIQDSLLILPYIYKSERLLDIGSGAGLPAIPIKIACPTISVVSVDKARKKINFQKHCKRNLDLKDFEPVCATINNLEHLENSFDVVTARALASLELFIHFGAKYVKTGGRLVALKSNLGADELEKGHCTAREYGLKLERIVDSEINPSGAKRKIVLYQRV